MSNEDIQHPKYHQNRRLQQAKMQRKVRKSQRRLSQLRALWRLFIIIFLIFLGVVILKLPQWRLHRNAFEVCTKPIFLVKTDNLKKSIMQLEPVRDVYIRRFWFPARLQIIIIERTPLITISPDINVPPIAFFSADGKLIGRDYMPLSPDFKTVKVITYGSGDDYRNWDKAKVNNFKKLAATVEMDSGETVEYIDYRNPKDVYVKIPTVNIRLGSFNAGTFDKIHRIPSLLPQVKMLNKKVKYIDLRWDTNYIKLDE